MDKGNDMLGCSVRLYASMDSLLNKRYTALFSACDSIQKQNLRDEQREWLSQRDKKFRRMQAELKKGALKNGYGGGRDKDMMLYHDKAKFVEARVRQLLAAKPTLYAAQAYKVDPTGLYVLGDTTRDGDGEIYGYFGNIAVKPIAQDKIVLRLYVCKGAPSYNSGEVYDTLTIANNTAIYRDVETDTTCRIIFRFFKRGVEVEEISADYNAGCGFGHAVIASGFYRRKSYTVPTENELKGE